jgi:hypothetical protein
LSAPSEPIELPTKPILLEPTILWLLEPTEPTELRLLESAEL